MKLSPGAFHDGPEKSCKRPVKTAILAPRRKLEIPKGRPALWCGDVSNLLDRLPEEETFDLVITSPPYNLGKPYERQMPLDDYLEWQESIIRKVVARTSRTGSVCWQVGNYVENGTITPLDIDLHPIFKSLGLRLRNRIVWRFGHGLHHRNRFSGRYEVIMWYTRSDKYTFNLDPVRIVQKYPSKRHHKGPNKGQYSSNPLGKNPEDVWDIPHVKSGHCEKTIHPCQFPVGLAERLVLALSEPGALVFDPFAGVASTGVAAVIHCRRFIGAERERSYVKIARSRLDEALLGRARYRPHDKPLYDHTQSKLSLKPTES
jgi:adenine-specific DNA-methyltransferase